MYGLRFAARAVSRPLCSMLVDSKHRRSWHCPNLANMSDTDAPQELVAAVLMSLVHAKPVLISPAYNFYETEVQISAVLDALTQRWREQRLVVKCKASTSWSTIQDAISACTPFSGLLIKNVDKLPAEVQIALANELMHPHSVISALMQTSVVLLSAKSPENSLQPGLCRHILMQEFLGPDDDFTSVELQHRHGIDEPMLLKLRQTASEVVIIPELLGYMQDIMVFLRNYRFAHVGVNPHAAQHLELVVRSLCMLSGSAFATPSIIKDAVRLVLPLQIRLLHYTEEPSLKLGGDLSAARVLRNEVNEVIVVESILKEIPIPI